jgi:hypothetical protein
VYQYCTYHLYTENMTISSDPVFQRLCSGSLNWYAAFLGDEIHGPHTHDLCHFMIAILSPKIQLATYLRRLYTMGHFVLQRVLS